MAMVDPHPVAHNWVHWLVVNLPKDATSIPEGASGKNMPAGATNCKTPLANPVTVAPNPRRERRPSLRFTLYALNVPKVDLPKSTNLAAFKQALEGKTLATATITGYFGR